VVNRLVPYEMAPPGFEAIYTGETVAGPIEPFPASSPLQRLADAAGNVYLLWSTWTWTWPGGEADWDADIRAINAMQRALGALDDETRRIRAHIGSLVPCDNGFPVTVDELLRAIGHGRLDERTYHNGCWMSAMWWQDASTQPGEREAMRTIEGVLRGYLEGRSSEQARTRYLGARGFIERTYDWLGPSSDLTPLQGLMMERLLLPFGFLTGRVPDHAAALAECCRPGGRGAALDAQIAELAGLPPIHADHQPEYRRALAAIDDPARRDLYAVCGAMAHVLHDLSACHHSTFRWIESWIHGIGTGRLGVPTRRAGAERERLGRLLLGTVYALDRWLLGASMQFTLLDLGHLDLGYDIKNEVLRVYAYLGEDRSPITRWLAACLWYTLGNNPLRGNPAGLVRHTALMKHAEALGLSTRAWRGQPLPSLPDHVAL